VRIRPGTIPPINILATEIFAKLAKRTPSELGGINMAKPLPVKIGPIIIGFLYPRFSISGTRFLPNKAAEAIGTPVRAARIHPEITANKLNLARTPPIHLSKVSIMEAATPDWNIISPINRNMGTARSEKLVRAAYILRMS
jgi:hypothetical protein